MGSFQAANEQDARVLRKPELSALTGVLFYAALFVFLSHVSVVPGMQALANERLLFNVGVVGVSFFFVLSGFILTYNYADVFRPGVFSGDYRRFVWDRWAKIYPVHIAALVLEAPMSMFSPNRPFLWSALPFHLGLLQCFWSSATPAFYDYLNIPSWSVSCEWFFYLLAPMTMSIVFGNARRRLGIVCAVLAYASALGWLLWSGTSDASRLYMLSWFAPSSKCIRLVPLFRNSRPETPEGMATCRNVSRSDRHAPEPEDGKDLRTMEREWEYPGLSFRRVLERHRWTSGRACRSQMFLTRLSERAPKACPTLT